MTTTLMFYVFAVLAAVGTYLLVRVYVGARLYAKFRGKRLVSCPETKQPAAVEVNAPRAAMEAVVGEPRLRLNECTRWPERQDCGQHCLREIESAPEDCLVRTIVTRWYRGKKCVYCGKPVGAIDWMGGQRAALRDAAQITIQWDQIPAEKLPEVFSTYSPVCWDCHIAQTFRREHPGVAVERPWRWR